MNNLLIDTFQEIRNYLLITDLWNFKFCDTEEEQFDEVIDIFKGNYSILKEHSIKETFSIDLVHEEDAQERHRSSDYDWNVDEFEDRPCFWVFKVKDKYFKLPGIYSSWENSEHHWDKIIEVDEKYQPINNSCKNYTLDV